MSLKSIEIIENIILFPGTVFNANTDAIVNTVNCMGVMGAGLALEFKLRYPEMYEDYINKCKKKLVKIGEPYLFIANDGTKIINFPTKYHWRYPSKIEWIKMGLEYFVQHYKEWNIKSIAFPKLGTNAGKLPWSQVKAVMVEYLKKVDIPVYICLDELEEAEGIEKEMIRILNENSIEIISSIQLRSTMRNYIINQLPIKRLRYLLNQKQISNKTYEKLFIELYNRAKKSQSNHYENLSFFDR